MFYFYTRNNSILFKSRDQGNFKYIFFLLVI